MPKPKAKKSPLSNRDIYELHRSGVNISNIMRASGKTRYMINKIIGLENNQQYQDLKKPTTTKKPTTKKPTKKTTKTKKQQAPEKKKRTRVIEIEVSESSESSEDSAASSTLEFSDYE